MNPRNLRERERERERERVINYWQVSLLACILAIFACLAFFSVPAFADEGEDSSSAELQASDYVHVVGGTSFYNAATLPLNKTNSFTVSKTRDYFYKFTLTSDGYISIPSKICDDLYEATHVKIYNSSQEILWSPGNYSMYYQNLKLGLPKGTYYLSFNHSCYSFYENNKILQMRLNFTSSSFWEKESNDSFETANNISVNTVYYGTGVNNSKDYYKFTVSNNMSVRVALKNTRWIGAQIFKQDLTKVANWYVASSQSGLTVNDGASFQLTKGTYYLCISNASYGNLDSDQE